MEYNVLLLSAGRRVELVQCFRKAADRLNVKSMIVGADCSREAPAIFFTDKFTILPKIASPDYIDSIISVCNREDIALVIPTIDTDLLLLAQSKRRIESETHSKVLVSGEDVIEICRNKMKSQRFFELNHFLAPHLYTDDELANADTLSFPLFIKPFDGSSSINAFKVHNSEELKAYCRIIGKYIVQDFVAGNEYTVDCFLDWNGNIITVVPRHRIATRCGEISKGKIEKDREIIEEVKKLLGILKPIGQITVQCIKTGRGVAFIEINPRFGGGAPMSISSGADSCENLYRLLRGENLKYNEDYRDHLTFLRFDNSICVNEEWDIVSDVLLK